MRPSKIQLALSICQHRWLHFLLAFATFYAHFLFFEFPAVSRQISTLGRGAALAIALDSEETAVNSVRFRPHDKTYRLSQSAGPLHHPDLSRRQSSLIVSGLALNPTRGNVLGNFSELHKSARDAWDVGRKVFEELIMGRASPLLEKENQTEEKCPFSIMLR